MGQAAPAAVAKRHRIGWPAQRFRGREAAGSGFWRGRSPWLPGTHLPHVATPLTAAPLSTVVVWGGAPGTEVRPSLHTSEGVHENSAGTRHWGKGAARAARWPPGSEVLAVGAAASVTSRSSYGSVSGQSRPRGSGPSLSVRGPCRVDCVCGSAQGDWPIPLAARGCWVRDSRPSVPTQGFW